MHLYHVKMSRSSMKTIWSSRLSTQSRILLHGTFTLCVVSSTAHPSSFQGEYSCKIHNVKKSTPVVSYLTALQNMTGQILLCNYAFFFVLLSWWYIIFLIKMYSVSKLRVQFWLQEFKVENRKSTK